MKIQYQNLWGIAKASPEREISITNCLYLQLQYCNYKEDSHQQTTTSRTKKRKKRNSKQTKEHKLIKVKTEKNNQ